MMRLFTIITVFTSGLRLTTAFRQISIPSVVHANQTVQLSISNDLSSSSSFDGQYTSFRVYLAIIAPSSSNSLNPANPSCYLINSSSITTSALNLTIPSSVGPDGTAYHIATLEYSTVRPHPPPPSSYELSPIFTLYNTTSSWSPADLAGAYPPFPDLLPCDAYDCARQCLASGFPQNVNGTEAGFADTYRCMAACPGVDYPSWKEVQEIGAAPGEPLAGDGNEGAETLEVTYATLLGSVSLVPTPTGSGNGTRGNASVSVRATAEATGRSEGVRMEGLGWMGLVVSVVALVI